MAFWFASRGRGNPGLSHFPFLFKKLTQLYNL
jgi:hypothetical protein